MSSHDFGLSGGSNHSKHSMMSTPTTMTGIAEGKLWKADPERFINGRNDYDFATLSFQKGSLATQSVGTATSSLVSSNRFNDEDGFWHDEDDDEAGGTNRSAEFMASTSTREFHSTSSNEFGSTREFKTRSSNYGSGEFSDQLNIAPSQRLVQRTSQQLRESKNSMNLPSKRSLVSSKEITMDKLAIHNLSIIGREQELQDILSTIGSRTPKDGEMEGEGEGEKEQEQEQANVNNKKTKTNSQMNIVIGHSGTGKSLLAQEVQNEMKSKHGWYVCYGKFDIQNRADPYQAIVQAMENWIYGLSESTKKLYKDIMTTQLDLEDGHLLVDLIPSMNQIVSLKVLKRKKKKEKQKHEKESNLEDSFIRDNTTATPTETKKDMKKRQKQEQHQTGTITERANQIQNVFANLLRIVGTKEHPIIMRLDDIQWASPTIISLLDSILEDEEGIKYFHLIMTCRLEYFESKNKNKLESATNNDGNGNDAKNDDEDDRPLSQLLTKHEDSIHTVTLKGLSVDSVQLVINHLLRMDERAERTNHLAQIVHSKTNGNPFFITTFLQALVDDEYLKYQYGTNTWEWYEVDIQSKSVADNVAQVVSQRLNKLQPQDLFLLQIASCISRTFDKSTMEFVLGGLDDIRTAWRIEEVTLGPLDTLVEKGILEMEWGNTRYAFCHDQIQQASYESIPSTYRNSLKVAIGRRFLQGMTKHTIDQFLLTAVEMLSCGIDQMEAKEKTQFAFWLFLAGTTAMKQGAFDTAYPILVRSIDCLGTEDAFRIDAQLALPLFCSTVEAAYCTGEIEQVKRYAQIVHQQKKHQVTPIDKLRVTLIEIKVDQHSTPPEYTQAVETYRKAINSFGGVGKIPKRPGLPRAIYNLLSLYRKVKKKYNKSKLLALPECTDPAILAATYAYVVIIPATYTVSPNLFILNSCLAMQWSLKYGVSKYTPLAWSSISVCLSQLDLDVALEIGESALALCDLHDYKEALPFTVNIVYGYVRHWKLPLQQFESPFLYGMELAKRYGDVETTAILMQTYAIISMLMPCNPIPDSIQILTKFRQYMISKKNDALKLWIDICGQYAVQLSTVTDSPTTLTGDFLDQTTAYESAAKSDIAGFRGCINLWRLHLHVLFECDCLEGCKMGHDEVIHIGFKFLQGNATTIRSTYLVGILESQAYEITNKSKHLKTAKAMMKRFQDWIKKGNPNVVHMMNLLTAEIARCTNKLETAKEFYQTAISTSARSGFKIDYAYFNQRCSLFYKDRLQDTSSAKHYMEDAVKGYQAIGATAVALHLKTKYPNLTS